MFYQYLLAIVHVDLVLGFSDIQKDIARDLIEQGVDVWIANHRSIDGILRYVQSLSQLVDKKDAGEILISKMLDTINKAKDFSRSLKQKPRVYFEEWDDPKISAIQWVGELIELCGGINIFKETQENKPAKDRFINESHILERNPDIIFACHCGKKVKIEKIKQRKGYEDLAAFKNDHIFELEPEIFLQPGPASILDGIDILIDYFKRWDAK